MRVAKTYWSCTLVLGSLFVPCTWAAKSIQISSTLLQGQISQAGLRMRVHETTAPEAALTSGEPRFGTTPVILFHPKITEAPLIRRKLGSHRWDLVHESIQGQKRDATSCPADYQLCPQSLKGGCCPTDRVCGENSCLPTNAAPASACGKVGYIACGIEFGGGCCPSGYGCGSNGCTPSTGVSNTQTCGLNAYLCPASLNFGCCRNGMACGLNECFATTITSFTFTNILTTTDDNSHTLTITTAIFTVATPAAPTPQATTDSGVIPKVSAPESPIPKTAAIGQQSNGLTRPQIGGIIGGAVAILLAILVAAFFIVRRLNTAIKASSEAASRARTRASSTGPSSGRPRPMPVDVDAMSVDPLIMTPSEATGSFRHLSHTASTRLAHEVDANQSPGLHSPFSPRSPPYSDYYRGYNAVATSDTSSGHRNPSLESSPPLIHNPNAGYFDIPTHKYSPPYIYNSPPITQSSRHDRNWSNASDQSAVSQNSSNLAELDAGADGDRRSNLQRALQGMGMGIGRMISRRKTAPTLHQQQMSQPSQYPTLTRHPARTEGSPNFEITGGNSGGLGNIAEAGESRLVLDMSPDADLGLSSTQLRRTGLHNSPHGYFQ